jgi:hypothetical protein
MTTAARFLFVLSQHLRLCFSQLHMMTDFSPFDLFDIRRDEKAIVGSQPDIRSQRPIHIPFIHGVGNGDLGCLSPR